MHSEPEITAVKDRAAPQLLAVPGVTGVGIGGRERAGRPTGELVIKVFVAEKLPPATVPPDQLIPAEIEGIPTDVVVMGRGRLLQAPVEPLPPGRPAVPVGEWDTRKYRPLVGGGRIHADLSGAGAGTLGCFLIDPADPARVYALSNHHTIGRVAATGAVATVGSTAIGQPLAKDSITKCCSQLIGTYAGGGTDATRDAAVARLDPGMKWQARIQEIGVVTGGHTITPAEAATLTYQVRQRGAKSRLTGGTVQAIGAMVQTDIVHQNVIVMTPNPDPADPAAQLMFAQDGDSGSVVVNADNQVVGLVFGGTDTQAWAFPIDVVLSRFQAAEGLALQVATATSDQEVNTVPGAAMVAVPPELVPVLVDDPDPASAPRAAAPAVAAAGVATPVLVPATQPWLPGILPPAPALLHQLEDDLEGSRTGRELIGLWLRHQREFADLVNHNRRVAVTWHRNGGPALLQSLVRMLGQPRLALPATVHGRPVAECLDRIVAGFARFGSAALRTDLLRVRPAVPELAGRTYPQIIHALGQS